MEPWSHRVQRLKYLTCIDSNNLEEFDETFTEDDIKEEWNVLLTHYRRERQAEKVARSSGAGIDDVFDSNWEHFQQMTFLESTPETNSPVSTLDKSWRIYTSRRFQIESWATGCILSPVIRNNSITPIVKIN